MTYREFIAYINGGYPNSRKPPAPARRYTNANAKRPIVNSDALLKRAIINCFQPQRPL